MDHAKTIRLARRIKSGEDVCVDFVTPEISTVCAALAKSPGRGKITFTPEAENYANFVRLTDALHGGDLESGRAGRSSGEGRAYTKLTSIARFEDIDPCNEVIADLIAEKLSNYSRSFTHRLVNVIGELHDNVSSHACARGFSSAQVYSNPMRIEFAIADSGRGMLRNARRFDASIQTHADAIRWCMEKNHTTAPTTDNPQRLPSDWMVSPYPDDVQTIEGENHHLGLGLPKLVDLVTECGGSLCVWSGDAVRFQGSDGSVSFDQSSTNWDGVAVFLSVPLREESSFDTQDAIDDAERWGL